ncbi:MAG: PqiC family protein [Methylococcales bacterium]|nr:PqiC family protein [Methylococcales bacterium]
MSNTYLNGCIALVLGSLLTACATPPTQFYQLEATSPPPVTSTTTAKKMLIGIGPLSLPALVDRKQIVTRGANNAIQLAEFHQWATPLQDNVLNVLSKNIAAQHSNAIVRSYPWSVYGEMNYRVIIDISRFDSQLGKSANLEASWAIMSEKNHTIISNGQTNIEQHMNDASYNSAVSALNKLLDTFSQQISLALHQIPQKE